MEIVLKTPEKMILRGEISYSLANALRRSVEEISTLAIDEVEIFKNDSALYDEMISLRLGLIPLKTEGKMNSKTTVELSLKKKGQGKVYSGDLKGSAKIVFDKIPITLLEDEQEIELAATARLGTALEHAKHIPGLVYYRNVLEVKSGNPRIESIIENSSGAIKKEKNGNKWICDLNEADVDEIRKIEEDAVKDTDELLIFVESYGSLDAEKIFEKAIEVLEENLDSFEKALK